MLLFTKRLFLSILLAQFDKFVWKMASALHIHTIFQVFQIMKEVIIFHNSYYFLVKNFLNPQSRPEGSYKIESVRPSFRLSVRFLRIGLLVFTET